jgi:hypothetical protein
MSAYRDQRVVIDELTQAAEKMLSASNNVYLESLMDRYREFARRVIADIAAITQEAQVDGTPSFSAFTRFQGDAKLLEVLSGEINNLNSDVVPGLSQQLVQQYRDAYNHSAWVLDQTTPPNIEIEYDIPHEGYIRQFVSTEWSGAMFSQRIGAINDFMSQDIQQAVTQAMMSGTANQDLARIISGIIETSDSSFMDRARTIAVTETARAATLARNNFFDQNDEYIDDWYWVSRSIMSPRICDDCAERSTLSYDEVVKIAPSQDHDELDPPIHPRCSCSWMARAKSFKKLLGPELSKGMDDKPYWLMAYNQNDNIIPAEVMKYDHWSTAYLKDFER